jgi:hypothetical protein
MPVEVACVLRDGVIELFDCFLKVAFAVSDPTGVEVGRHDVPPDLKMFRVYNKKMTNGKWQIVDSG